MFSIRIVTTSHYQATPIPGLDVLHSDFRDAKVPKVPVLRIFGSTPAGQKTCMHVHGVFPYLYVRYDGTQPLDRYLRQFAASLDMAINIGNRIATSNMQHVFKISLVSGIPMYGYHSQEEQFLKIYLYNPNNIRKAADLLLGGAVMNKPFQPHESHISFPLQLFMDYNLYGMNLISVGALKFRKDNSGNEVKENQDDDEEVKGSSSPSSSPSFLSAPTPIQPDASSSSTSPSSNRVWSKDTIPSDLWHPDNVEKQSVCELEVDITAADIVNRQELMNNVGKNPGLTALWEDERKRRRDAGLSSQIIDDNSQDREGVELSASEDELLNKFLDMVRRQQEMRDTQSTEDMEESQPSLPASQIERHLSREDSVTSSQSTVILGGDDEDEGEGEKDKGHPPIVSVDSINKVVASSQSFHLSGSQKSLSDTQDVAGILAAILEDDVDPPSSQVAALEEQDSILNATMMLSQEDWQKDEEETVAMSQAVVLDTGQEEKEPPDLEDLTKYDDDDHSPDVIMKTDDEDEDDIDLLPQFDGASDKISHPQTQQNPANESQSSGSSEAAMINQQGFQYPPGMQQRARSAQNYPADTNWASQQQQQQQQHSWHAQQQQPGTSGWQTKSPSWGSQHSQQQHNYPHWQQQQQQQQMTSPGSQPYTSPLHSTPASPFHSPTHNPYASPSQPSVVPQSAGYQSSSPSSSQHSFSYHSSPFHSPTNNESYQSMYPRQGYTQYSAGNSYQSPTGTDLYQSPTSSHPYKSPTSVYPSPTANQPYHLPSGSSVDNMSPTTSQAYHRPASTISKSYQSPLPSSSGMTYPATLSNQGFRTPPVCQGNSPIYPQSSMYPQHSYQSSPQGSRYPSPSHLQSWSGRGAAAGNPYGSGYFSPTSHQTQATLSKVPDSLSHPNVPCSSDSTTAQGKMSPFGQSLYAVTSGLGKSGKKGSKDEQKMHQYQKQSEMKKTIQTPQNPGYARAVKPSSTMASNKHQKNESVVQGLAKLSDASTATQAVQSAGLRNQLNAYGNHEGQNQTMKNVPGTDNEKKLELPMGSFGKPESEMAQTDVNVEMDNSSNYEGTGPNPCATPMIQQLLMEESPAKVNITPPSLEDKNIANRKAMLSPTLPTATKGKKKTTKGKGAKQGLRQRSASLTSPPSIPPYGGVFRPQTMPTMGPGFNTNISNRPHHPMSYSQMGAGYPRKSESGTDWQKQFPHSEPVQQQHFSPVTQWQQQQHQWGGQQWQQDYTTSCSLSGDNEPKQQDNCLPSGNIPTLRMQHRSYSADCAPFVYSPNDPPSSSSSFGGQMMSPQATSSNESNPATQPETGSFVENAEENGTLSSLLGLMTEDGLWDDDTTPCLVTTFGHQDTAANNQQQPSTPLKSNPTSETPQDSPLSKDFITLKPATKYKSDTGMASSEESDRMDFEIAADLIPAKIPSVTALPVSSHPKVGKQNRAKTMDMLCRDIVHSNNLCYTYTFHVPTPLFKRLKFYKSAQARKHDLKVLRMHPLDARKYSLLKIGKEIVKLIKLSEEDLAKYNLTLPLPGELSHTSSDWPLNRVNLDIPPASSSRSSGSSYSDEGHSSLSSYDTDFPPNKVAPPSSLPSGQVLPPSRNVIRPTTPPSSSSNMPWPRHYQMASPSSSYQMAGNSIANTSNNTCGSSNSCYVNTFPPNPGSSGVSNLLLSNEHSPHLNPYVTSPGRENYVTGGGPYPYHGNSPSLRNNSISVYNGQNHEMASTSSSYSQGTHQYSSGQQPTPYNNSSGLYPYQQPPHDGRLENGMPNTIQNQKNGLRSPGQHGPTDTIDTDRLSGCGDGIDRDDNETLNTTEACPVNARVNAQIRNVHADTCPNRKDDCFQVNGDKDMKNSKQSYNSIYLNNLVRNEYHWSEPIRASHDSDMVSPVKHRRSRRTRNRRSSLKKYNHRQERDREKNTADKSSTGLKMNHNPDRCRISTDMEGQNSASDLVIRIKRDRFRFRSKKKDKNWKSLRLKIPKQNFAANPHWTDFASNADSASLCSSQKESDGEANVSVGKEELELGDKEMDLNTPQGVRQSMRQAKLRSIFHRDGSDVSRFKEKKKKQSLKEGVHYIVVGKFKGHQKMMVKISRIPVRVEERVKADNFLEMCQQEVVRSASTNSEYDESSLNSDGYKHPIQIVIEDSQEIPPVVNNGIPDESPGSLSVDQPVSAATSPETPFFCRLKKTFIKRQGGKGWINVSQRTKRKNNVFFPGVVPRMFIHFQATFHDNIAKLEECQDYSSSSDDEDDYLEDIILRGKVQYAKELGYLKDSIMERLTQTETFSLANIPSTMTMLPDEGGGRCVRDNEKLSVKNTEKENTELCSVDGRSESLPIKANCVSSIYVAIAEEKCSMKIKIKQLDSRSISPVVDKTLKSVTNMKTMGENELSTVDGNNVSNVVTHKLSFQHENIENITPDKDERKVPTPALNQPLYEDICSSPDTVVPPKESVEDRKEFIKRQMAFYEDISSDPDTDDTIVDVSSTYNTTKPPPIVPYDSSNFYNLNWDVRDVQASANEMPSLISKIDQTDTAIDKQKIVEKGKESTADKIVEKGKESTADKIVVKGRESTADKIVEKGKESTADKMVEKGRESTADKIVDKGRESTADKIVEKGRESTADCKDIVETQEMEETGKRDGEKSDDLSTEIVKENEDKQNKADTCPEKEGVVVETIPDVVIQSTIGENDLPKNKTALLGDTKKSTAEVNKKCGTDKENSKLVEQTPTPNVVNTEQTPTPNVVNTDKEAIEDVQNTKKGAGRRKKKREMELLGGFGTSSNEEKEGSPFPSSKRLRQRKQTKYTFHLDGIDSSSSSENEESKDPVFFQQSQSKRLYPNKKEVTEDKSRPSHTGKQNKQYTSRSVRGKRKKGAGSSKLLNSLSLLHMATLANLTESQDSPASPTNQEQGESDATGYNDGANSDHCQNYSSSLETMSFATPPDEEELETSPPLALSPEEKLTKIKQRNLMRQSVSSASCRVLNFPTRHRNRIKPGSNGSSNLGTRPFSISHLVTNSASSSPIPANFFTHSAMESSDQQVATIKLDKDILELEKAKAMSFSMKQILRMAMTDDSMDSDSKDGMAVVKPRESKRAQVKSTALSMSDIMKMTSSNSAIEEEGNREVNHTILACKKELSSGGGGKAEVKDVALSFKDIMKMNQENDASDNESCSSIPKPLFSNDGDEKVGSPLSNDQCDDVKNSSSFNLTENSFIKSSSPSDISTNIDSSLAKSDPSLDTPKECCADDIDVIDESVLDVEKLPEKIEVFSETMDTSVKRKENSLKLEDAIMVKCLSPLTCIIEESQISRISRDEVTSGEPDNGIFHVGSNTDVKSPVSLKESNQSVVVGKENVEEMNDDLSPDVIEPSQELKPTLNIPTIQETLVESSPKSVETDGRNKDAVSLNDGCNKTSMKTSKELSLLHPLQIPSFPKGVHTWSSSSSSKACSSSSPHSYPWCWQWQPHGISDALNSPLNLSTSSIKSTTVYSPITPTSPISPHAPIHPPHSSYYSSKISQDATAVKNQSPPPPAKKSKPLWYPWLSKEESKSAHSATETTANTNVQEHSEDLSISKKDSNETNNKYLSFTNGRYPIVSSDYPEIRNHSSDDLGVVGNMTSRDQESRSLQIEAAREMGQNAGGMCKSESSIPVIPKKIVEEVKNASCKTQRGLRLSECASVSQFVGSVIETAYERRKGQEKNLAKSSSLNTSRERAMSESESDLSSVKQNKCLNQPQARHPQQEALREYPGCLNQPQARHPQQEALREYPGTSSVDAHKMTGQPFFKNGFHSSRWDMHNSYSEQLQRLHHAASLSQPAVSPCGNPLTTNEGQDGVVRKREDERIRTMLENERALRGQFSIDSNPQTPVKKGTPGSPGSSGHMSLTDRLVTQLIKGESTTDPTTSDLVDAAGSRRRGQKRSQGRDEINPASTSGSTGSRRGTDVGNGGDDGTGKGKDKDKREQPGRPKPCGIVGDRSIVIHPEKRAPSRLSVESSLLHYGLNTIQVPAAFCSSVQDLPDKPVDAGGRVLSVPSKRLSELKEFESSPFLEGVKTIRNKSLASSSLLSSQLSNDPLTNALEQDPAIRFMFGPDKPVVISPCRLPPKRTSVAEWLHVKLMEVMKGKENIHLQTETTKKKTKRKSVMFSQLPSKADLELEHSPKHSSTSPPPPLLSPQSPICSSQDESKNLIDTDLDTSRSPSQTPAPIHSPSPRISPPSSSTRYTKDSKKRKRPLSPTHPEPSTSQTTDAIAGSGRNKKDSKSRKGKVKLEETHPSSVINVDTDFASSTPVRRTSKDLFDPTCTPISSREETQQQPKEETEDSNAPSGVSTQILRRISTNTESTLRRNILMSQPRRQFSNLGFNAAEVSQIEGPTPKNSFGFKVSTDRGSSAKAAHKYQCITAMSLELHVETRGDLRPNPDFDAVKAIFYSIFDDIPEDQGHRNMTGVIMVDLESWHVITERNKRLTTPKPSPSSKQSKPSQGDPNFNRPSTSSKSTLISSPPFSSLSTSSSLSFTQNVSASRTKSQTPSPKPSTSKARSPSPSPSPSKSPKGKGRKKAVATPPPVPKSVGMKASLERCALDENLEVTYVQDETDLMLTLVDLIHRFDPDILVGFEIQLLSWGYLLQRAARLNLELCSRIARIPGAKESNFHSADKDQWGAEVMSEIHVVGRIVLNLWRILRHEVSLNTYTFENCAYHILHQRLPLFSFRDLTKWFAHDKQRWRVIDFYVSRVQGHLKMIDQLDLIGKTSEFARVFGIEFYDVLSRGTQIRVESMMLRLAKPMNYVAVSPNVNQRARQRAPECIALTLEPESKYYTSPVVVLDFQSLYPSIMIAYNYCFSTCLGRLDFLNKANDGPIEFGCTSLNVPPKILKSLRSKVNISPTGIVFVKSSVRKGIISSMVEEILNTRIMVKKSMKDCKDDKAFTRMLGARQLGLKLIANVTYGYTAANFSGRMPCVEVADSIVRKARESLERAIQLVKDTPRWGGHVIYGDTDSLFIHFPGRSKDEAFVLGQEIADAVTAMFPKPMKLQFEKVYLPCVLQSKKRYVGFMYETPDQKEPVYDAKGIETVRRDSCSAVSKILERSIKVLFSTHDLSRVRSYVCRQLHKLLEGKVSLLDLVFAKEFRGMMGYKPGACVPSLEIARKRVRLDPCSEPRVGERVPYVIVHGSPGLPLIQLVREPQDLIRDRTLRLNAVYYITKQILPPLDRVFSLIGINVFKWYHEMPKVVRVGHLMGVDTSTKQGTISQFFATSNCPVCDAQTKTPICGQCRRDPQLVVTTLNTKIHEWEDTYNRLSRVCTTCQGTQDRDQSCVSVDCPIVFRRHVSSQDLHRADALNQTLSKFLDF